MLKWTVVARRDAGGATPATRHSTASIPTPSASSNPKRRHSSSSSAAQHRRRRRSHHNSSLVLQLKDKENAFTASTPIKQQHTPLRDVSNVVTPAATKIRSVLSAKKTPNSSRNKVKKKAKKDCTNPSAHNFFQPFEAVDSHIKGILDDDDADEVEQEKDCFCKPLGNINNNNNNNSNKRKVVHEGLAPTLPTFALEYSPCLMMGSSSATPLNKFFAESHTLTKKPRIEHVNDFLHQITFLPSPEEEKLEVMESTKFASLKKLQSGVVSPLVRKFVDLRFGKKLIGNDSSMIDDLSLDQIVDAILDSSGEKSVVMHDQNELNKTHEENFLNAEKEMQKGCKTSSTDSGFKSSGAEAAPEHQDHQLQGNFKCKCSLEADHTNNKTIIPMNETFNERCVDEDEDALKKRVSRKRPYALEKSIGEDGADGDFRLKRQRCVRRRQRGIVCERKEMEESFDPSIISGKIGGGNESTPLEANETYLVEEEEEDETTPLMAKEARFRRCLMFESPCGSGGATVTLSESSASSAGSCCSSGRRSRLAGDVKGTMDLNIVCKNDGELLVNIIRCKDLSKSTKGKQINAYVKVALSDRLGRRNGLLQRTAVQANSSKPFFNHTFKFQLEKYNSKGAGIHEDEEEQINNNNSSSSSYDCDRRLHIEVWHRDRSSRTSEFLGCMSFDIKDVCEKEISGSYRLLPQSTGRVQNAPITSSSSSSCDSFSAPKLVDPAGATTMCESHSDSVEEMMSLAEDVIDQDLKKSGSKSALSEQQKHADENLFLRYLELDPVEGPDAIPAALQRKATGNKNGRTPFTQTKTLKRPPKSGFGFSVVWTHPPRIERVEKGLPADKAGILPGDYLIFVDKHNVVMMPEIDILNLIRSYGSQLTLEIFRRNASRNGSVPSVKRLNSTGTCSTTGLVPSTSLLATSTNLLLGQQQQQQLQRRPSTVCSTNATSIDYNRRKLHLPQVTFSAEKTASSNQEESRKKVMYQLLSKEQQYATGLQFAVTRFVSALAERTDLITPSEHKILFQNVEEILRITEDIIDNLMQDDGEPQIHIIIHTYCTKLSELTTAYKRYCSGIKKADCVLANKSRLSNCEFVRFLQNPSIPKRRPDITTFIHKPLEHFREMLKLLTVIQSYTKSNHEDYTVINRLVHDLQSTYREITAEAGLMEPMGEGRPLLTVQDLENRLVFTKCKPFVLNKPGRQWIFGGDLGRVEGRNIRQYWTLLFSDLLLFAKVSRDRVLFIIEDPLPLTHITDMFFNVRKKDTEFRITINPDGCHATSPTVHCGPDLTRTPKKNANKRIVILRAPTAELKAVWQNLLQRQIFHVNAGMDGSSFSSPLESPDAPITSSVATLQSAESLSFRRQTPQNLNIEHSIEMQKQIDAIIEHKCKQLSKTQNAKGNAIHLEKWMKGQLDNDCDNGSISGGHLVYSATAEDDVLEPLNEEWTEEMLRKRSEELQLIDAQGNVTFRPMADVTHRHHHQKTETNCKFDEFNMMSSVDDHDHDQSPSKSTTTESQVTVRSSPLVPETVPVCRQCHKNCIQSNNLVNNNNSSHFSTHNHHQHHHNSKTIESNCVNKDLNDNKDGGDDDDGDWRPLLLMGLSAINPAASLVKLDPFAAPPTSASSVPKINVAPPTPESSIKLMNSACNCQNKPANLDLFADVDASPDDSPQTEEHPYHSLSSSNLTLRRFGTVSSLERLGEDDRLSNDDNQNSSESDGEGELGGSGGIDNEAFYQSSIRNWTAKAGSFVAEKMAFFGGLGEEYKSGGRFFERYLKTSESNMNGDDLQEDETSGATSGEEIWGTPTSGGELDDPLSSPNYEGKNSPYDGSISSENGDDTELMMDELLMTPPISGAVMRGLLPRRTLEPLIEEDGSESCSPTSSGTPTEPSVSPEQGNGTGGVADICSSGVVESGRRSLSVEEEEECLRRARASSAAERATGEEERRVSASQLQLHRSESYRRIVEAADEECVGLHHHLGGLHGTMGFFSRFRPAVRFVNIERVPRAKSVKIFEFFNVRRERRIHQAVPEEEDGQLIKMFSKEGTVSDTVPTAYAEKPISPRRFKDKQLDRRFWKQLSRRRGNKMESNLPA